MIIDRPQTGDIPALRRLWQQAFGDTDAFLDSFFAVGFSPDRCRCLWLDDCLASALYWFDCSWEEKPVAYLYAVATDEKFRGRGLCRALMEATHSHLQKQGYVASVLVPGTKELFRLYEKMGYQTFSGLQERRCVPADEIIPLRKLTAAEYAAARASMLPKGSVEQGLQMLECFAAQGDFYGGEGFVLAATWEYGTLTAREFLGDIKKAPRIAAALGAKRGRFRIPGETPFAMHYPLRKQSKAPAYFAIALD